MAEVVTFLRVHIGAVEKEGEPVGKGRPRAEISLDAFFKIANGDRATSRRDWEALLGGTGRSNWEVDAKVPKELITRVAELLIRYWPGAVRAKIRNPGTGGLAPASDSLPAEREMTVEEISDRLFRLYTEDCDLHGHGPVASTSLRRLVTDHMALTEPSKTVEQVRKELEEACRSSVVTRLLPGAIATVSRDTVYRLLAKENTSAKPRALLRDTGLQYFLLIRAFAAVAGYSPRQLARLPLYPLDQTPVDYGAFMWVELRLPEGTPHKEEQEATTAFRRLCSVAVKESLETNLHRNHAEVTPTGARPLPEFVKDSATPRVELALVLTTRISLPGPDDYGWPLLLLADLARTLQIGWANEGYTIARLSSGREPLRLDIGIHAGARSSAHRVAASVAQHSPTGIVFSGPAYYHARAQDIRILFDDQVTARNDIVGDGLMPCYPLREYLSSIYFGTAEPFRTAFDTQATEYRDRCWEIFGAHPVNTFYGIELAVAAFHAEEFWMAIEVASRVLAMDPKHTEAHSLIALCYANMARRVSDPTEDSGAFQISQWQRVAQYYQRAIMAGLAAVRAGPRHEDAHDLLGLLYVLRAQDFLGGTDLVALRSCLFENKQGAASFRQVLQFCGYATATPDRLRSVAGYGAVELSLLIRDLRLEDLYRAHRHINDAIDVSPTRSRSIFWRLIVEGLLREAEVAGGAALPRIGAPDPIFDELGWIREGDPDYMERRAKKAVYVFDQSMLQECYRPDLYFAYAVFYLDFSGLRGDKELQELGEMYLRRAVDLATEIKQRHQLSGRGAAIIMRGWGCIQSTDKFLMDCERALEIVAAEKGAQEGHKPLSIYYLGSAFS